VVLEILELAATLHFVALGDGKLFCSVSTVRMPDRGELPKVKGPAQRKLWRQTNGRASVRIGGSDNGEGFAALEGGQQQICQDAVRQRSNFFSFNAGA